MIIDDATLEQLTEDFEELPHYPHERAERLITAYRRLRDVFVALGIEVE